MSLTIRSLNNRAQYLGQVAENAARLARLSIVYQSQGSGEQQLKDPVNFDIHFLEEPAITSGRALAFSTQALVPGKYPNGDSGVYDWVRDDRGFYVGAYLYFVLDTNGQSYTINHHITFEGEALKMFSADLMHQADEESKRTKTSPDGQLPNSPSGDLVGP